MRITTYVLISLVAVFFFHRELNASTPYGFHLPDSLEEVTVQYQNIGNLVVLPVIINGSIRANLVLDTGCRNLVLFGRRLRNVFGLRPARQAIFSGLGRGKPLTGDVFLGNEVRIDRVIGHEIPVVVVNDRSAFRNYHEIDGVIGYEIFLEFEAELDPGRRTITFRSAEKARRFSDFSYVPLQVNRQCPVIESQVDFSDNPGVGLNLMIDTGSALGLLLKNDDGSEMERNAVIGYGLNGPLTGYNRRVERLAIADYELYGVDAVFCASAALHDGSLGMAILKDYAFILNYFQGYAAFRRLRT